MSLEYGFYNSIDHDRVYDATDMSKLFDGIIKDGVFGNIGNTFAVTPGSGLSVVVGSGRAWFNSTWSYLETPETLAIDTANTAYDRIDAVVLEVNALNEVRANTLKVIKGTPSSSPVKPTLVNSDGVYQHALAYITVKKNATSIGAADIENMVGTNSCPFVIGAVDNVDVSFLLEQWGGEFREWFDNLHYILDGDVAGHLQNEIEETHEHLNQMRALIGNVDDKTYKIGDVCISTFAKRDNKWAVAGTTYNESYEYMLECARNATVPQVARCGSLLSSKWGSRDSSASDLKSYPFYYFGGDIVYVLLNSSTTSGVVLAIDISGTAPVILKEDVFSNICVHDLIYDSSIDRLVAVGQYYGGGSYYFVIDSCKVVNKNFVDEVRHTYVKSNVDTIVYDNCFCDHNGSVILDSKKYDIVNGGDGVNISADFALYRIARYYDKHVTFKSIDNSLVVIIFDDELNVVREYVDDKVNLDGYGVTDYIIGIDGIYMLRLAKRASGYTYNKTISVVIRDDRIDVLQDGTIPTYWSQYYKYTFMYRKDFGRKSILLARMYDYNQGTYITLIYSDDEQTVCKSFSPSSAMADFECQGSIEIGDVSLSLGSPATSYINYSKNGMAAGVALPGSGLVSSNSRLYVYVKVKE